MADALREEFEQQVDQLKRFTEHGPSLGRFIELLLINLLRKYLPNSLAFGSGFVYSMRPDLKKRTSSQVDILCYDRFNFPVLFDSNEIVVVPPRAVHGLIECKSTLSKKSLNQVLLLGGSEVLKEVPNTAFIHLLSVKSQIRPETAETYIRKHYESATQLETLLGVVYSIDWPEMIIFRMEKIKGRPHEWDYTCTRVHVAGHGIAPFVSLLIAQLYGYEQYEAIANTLAPSAYVPTGGYCMRLYRLWKNEE